jgi:Cu/Zn superoxide dismutase
MNLKTGIAFAAAFAACCAVSPAAGPKTITVPMKALHGSGETGMATLTQLANGVKVVVDVKNAPASAQPTHIHAGTCTKLNPAPEYPLTSLVAGKSVTVIPGKKLSDLMGGKYAVNVHKSASDLPTYVSCGAIK